MKGQIDYETQNMCRKCQLKVNKIIHPITCPKCHLRLHTRKLNKNRGKPYEKKYIE